MNSTYKHNQIYFNPQINQTLVSILSDGRLPNTILIEGEKGTGKKVLAKQLAAGVVCSSNPKPCGLCRNCLKAEKGIHPDIKIIAAEEKQKTITVDMIREIRGDANIVPNDAQNKVYIIVNAQNMNREAQNALLKLIEEPPPFAYFILTVPSRGMLLETVVSRSFILKLKTPSIAQCQEYLTATVADKPLEEIARAAVRSKGNIGRALDILENSQWERLYSMADAIATAAVGASEFELLSKFSALESEKDHIKDILELLKEIFCDALYLKTGFSIEHAVARQISGSITSLQITQVIDIIENGIKAVGTNANKALLLAWLCSSIKAVILK